VSSARIYLSDLGSRAGFEPEGEAIMHLPRNPDPGFTPGSTPDFGPGSGSTSVAVSSNKTTEPIDFTLLAS
jgi:hypothetical protein